MKSATLMMLVLVCMALRPDTLSAQSLEDRVVLRDVPGLQCLAISPDGQRLATMTEMYDENAREHRVRVGLWETATGAAICSSQPDDGESRISYDRLAFAPDRRSLVSCGSNGIFSWRMRRRAMEVSLVSRRLVDEAGSTDALVFFPDGKRFVTVGEDVHVRKSNGISVLSFPRHNGGNAIPVLSPDRRILASPAFQDVDLYDVETGKERQPLLDHRGAVEQLSFSPDGQELAVLSCYCETLYKSDQFMVVKLWDVAKGTERQTFEAIPGFPRFLAWSHDRKGLLVFASHELGGPLSLRFLNLQTRQWSTLRSFKGLSDTPESFAITTTANATLVAAAYPDRTIHLWTLQAKK